MTKATIEISDESYEAILEEQLKRRKRKEKANIAELASFFLDLGVKEYQKKLR